MSDLCTELLSLFVCYPGFYAMGRQINCMCFRPEEPNTLLLGAQDGKIVEVQLPDRGPIDNSESYEICSFQQRFFKYTYTTTIVVGCFAL